MGNFYLWLPLLTISATALSLQSTKDLNALATLNNKLATDLHKKLTKDGENLFFSPLSISSALAMLYYGARGETAAEMRKALGYENAGLSDDEVHSAFGDLMETFSSNSADTEYLLNIANAMLIQKAYPVRPAYQVGIRTVYKAMSREVDFQQDGNDIVREINDWVKSKTNNQIEKFLDELDPSSIMVLLNAVYFKGKWKTKFEHTAEGIFYNKGLESEKVKTEMMHIEGKVLYMRYARFQVIELPYKGEDISMIVLLPTSLDGLPRVENELTSSTIKDFRRIARNTTMIVTLPKFKIKCKETLNRALQQIGIKNVFSSSANLSGISASGPLAVSNVAHEAVIEVNEEGSEASGATGIVVVPVSAILDNRFDANRPFAFAIVDRRSDMILFQGSIKKL